ncbi:hypothetical protein [Agarivorans sp. B2Z047]|uniref:hypothetical protein n=1 Tax=Agarivorans sp. B2Z047 TaxID=2652721 RepID=UPI001883BB53|nr:hypothetical protein [Agarivorans sp. B2Z047]UQN41963.1 hypothetical protein LQZ07_19640 [Agarivorans sp. B2Z047]
MGLSFSVGAGDGDGDGDGESPPPQAAKVAAPKSSAALGKLECFESRIKTSGLN